MVDIRPQEVQKKETQPRPEPVKETGGVSFIEKVKAQAEEESPGVDLVREEMNRAGVLMTADVELADKIVSKAKSILRPLRTYKDDVAEILKRTHGSKISIQTAETTRQNRLQEEAGIRARAELIERQKETQLKYREKLSKKEQERLQRETSAKPKVGRGEIGGGRGDTPEPFQLEKRQAQLVAEQKIKEEQSRIKFEQQQLQSARENRRQEATNQPAKSSDHRPIKYRVVTLLISVLFIAVGGGVLYGAYSIFFVEEPRVPQLMLDTLILAEKNVDVDVTGLNGREFLSELTRARDNASSPINTIVNFTPLEVSPSAKDNKVNTKELAGSFFFELIAPSGPTALPRSVGDKYMLGLFVSAENQMFLIIKPTFYESTFAGMLAWEKSMAQDLFPLFERHTLNTVSSGGETTYAPPKNQFQDKVIDNKDTRVLYDSFGEIVLLYSFISRDTLIITNGGEAFLEVFKRMSAKKVSN